MHSTPVRQAGSGRKMPFPLVFSSLLFFSLKPIDLELKGLGSGELGKLNKDIGEIERMLKAPIKSLENKTPWTLGPSSPTELEKNLKR